MNEFVFSPPARYINPAQDFVDGKLYYGVWARLKREDRESDTLILVNSDKEWFDALDPNELEARNFKLRTLTTFTSRWSFKGVSNFLNGGTAPAKNEPYDRLVKSLRTYIEFGDDREYSLVSLWAMGTYLISIFRSYPYLCISGLKRTGKSKLLSWLEQVCFNAISSADITDPGIFRIVDCLRATILMDEAATLETREAKRTQKQLLWAGYKRGAKAYRAEKTSKGTIAPQAFEIYSPKAFVTYEGAEEILADRSISITMLRSDKKEICDTEIKSDDPEWQEIRDMLYSWSMHHFKGILEVYGSIESPGLFGRERELWAPILSLAKYIDDGIYSMLLELAKEKTHAKLIEDLQGYRELKVLQALVIMSKDWDEDERHLVSSTAVKGIVDTLLDSQEEKKWLDTTRIQRIMRSSFGFGSEPQGRRVMRVVTKRQIWNLARRYGLSPEELLLDERQLLKSFLRQKLTSGERKWEKLLRQAEESFGAVPNDVFELLDELSKELGITYNLEHCPRELNRTVDGRRFCSEEIPPCGVHDPSKCPFKNL